MSLWFLMWFLMWPCLRHIVCTSFLAVVIVPMDPNCVSCPKILVIDVTVVPDVVPNVALLKTYCLHIIHGSLCCPYGPQLCFLFQKY